MNTTPQRLLNEFASTFKEWHYLVGGGATGFVLGFAAAVYLIIRLFRAERRGRRPTGHRRYRRGGFE